MLHRGPSLCRGPLVQPIGTGMTVLEKKKKLSEKEEKQVSVLGSLAPTVQSSWPLVMWNTSFTHQHMDLPTITLGAQNHKDGPFHSHDDRANTCHNKVRHWKYKAVLVLQSLYLTQCYRSFSCLLFCHIAIKGLIKSTSWFWLGNEKL